MAYAKRRGNGRYTAVVQLADGSTASAGTYDTKERAEQVAAEKEHYIRKGQRGIDPELKATITVREYMDKWLPNHAVEPSTKTNYENVLRVHVLPFFGDVRLCELEREAVRSRFAEMEREGRSLSTRRTVRAALSAMFTTALSDGYRSDHPVRGISLGKRRQKTRKVTVMTTDQFGTMLRKLPTRGAQALARIIIGTGCRPSEAFALTPSDIDFDRGTITFAKAIQNAKAKYSPTGQSMFIAETKSHEERVVRIDKRLLNLLADWIANNDLGSSDFLFTRDLVLPYARGARVRRPRIELTEALIESLGTFVGPNGRSYSHGTMNGYTTGCCHCDYCKQGLADYRYDRNHKRNPRMKRKDREVIPASAPFMTTSAWSAMVTAACKAAEMPFRPTAYQLRHTHASWLIANGEDPKTVMERLGHTDLSITSVYVHAVDDGSSSADIMGSLGLDWDDDAAV